MLAALIAVPIITIIDLGGVDPVVEPISQVRPDALSIFAGTTFAGIVSTLAWVWDTSASSHYRALHGNAHPRRRKVRPPHRHQLDGPDRVQCSAVHSMGIAYFARHPEASSPTWKRGVGLPGPLRRFSSTPLLQVSSLAAVLTAIMSTLSSQADRVLLRSGGGPYGIFSSKKLTPPSPCGFPAAGVALVAGPCLAWNPNSSIPAAGRFCVGCSRFGIRPTRSTSPLLA